MTVKDELLTELLELHQSILKTHTGSLEGLSEYVQKLGDAVVACIQTETELMARIVLLERSVVYKELPE